MRKEHHQRFQWKGSFETLEERRVMSADSPLDFDLVHHGFVEEAPLVDHMLISEPDFWIDPTDETTLSEQIDQIEQTLTSAHSTTGLNQVVADYGFTGIGQTVAVIDSGIAYDHYALGGGFGANYRVVGGWDFTGENDANPYDDGSAGSHGTHVAGIIGGSAGSDHGVAPGVDLVALRVFDDSGAGYFSWVEKALQWVHTNRNNFENPITAVNLSLGVASWNSVTVPTWSTLEDEFAQLEADGIFVAVSAGNSYATYNTPGLGYPAASPYVVPVMSVNDNGTLASYSQRDVRAIAAPGSSIRSTVPDYKGNNNGITDDYATFSGTSMASPYIAASSVLVRQAMQFVGTTNITQDMIFNHVMSTGTKFVDSATGLTFTRLNLEAAIDALMPTDDYGSTVATGFNLGSLTTSATRDGVISTLGDVDYFTFTAASSGTVTFTVSEMTHQLAAEWSTTATGGTVSGNQGENFQFDVVAGQSYTVGLSSSAGLGYYSLDASLEASFSFVDWGTIASSQLMGLSTTGEGWYRLQASQSGFLTAESLFAAESGQISLELYNANMQLLTSGNPASGTSRVDTYATMGQEFFLRVLGTNADVDFRLTNLVSLSGTTVNVAGTAGNDLFSFTAGTTHSLTVNGTAYTFASFAVNGFSFNGGAGSDSIYLIGTTGNETATLQSTSASFVGTGFTTTAAGTESITVYGGGGADRVNFYDTTGIDRYVGKRNLSRMTGTGYSHTAYMFNTAYAYSNAGGVDLAEIYDTPGNDHFQGKPSASYMSGTNYYQFASNFEYVYAYSIEGGNDTAELYDSPDDDVLISKPDYTVLRNSTSWNYVHKFESTYSYAMYGGYDKAHMYDSAGNDLFIGRSDYSVFSGTGFYNYAKGFDYVSAYAINGGIDSARLLGTAGNDTFSVRSAYSTLYGANYAISAQGFEDIVAWGMGGNDTAVYWDISSADNLYGRDNYFQLLRSSMKSVLFNFTTVKSNLLSGATPAMDIYDTDYVFELLGS
jgi:subtilisin family serine protease